MLAKCSWNIFLFAEIMRLVTKLLTLYVQNYIDFLNSFHNYSEHSNFYTIHRNTDSGNIRIYICNIVAGNT